MKDSIVSFLSFCLFFGSIIAFIYGMLALEKSDFAMNENYDVWFEGENAYALAAASDKLAYSRDDSIFLLKVREEMELQDVIQHRYHGHNQRGTGIYYSIQFKNEQNEMVDYKFSYYEHAKIMYRDDIVKPILKRVENDVHYNNHRPTLTILELKL